MIPAATTILRLRFVAHVLLRALAICLIARGLYLGIGRSVFYVQSIANPPGAPFGPPGFWDSHESLVLHLLAAAVLLASERWLVPWLIPALAWCCPSCRYTLDRLASPRCPECGVPLPAEWVDRPPAETRP